MAIMNRIHSKVLPADRESSPDEVDDAAVQRFSNWLEGRTLHAKPKDVVRAVPIIWNEARSRVAGWPDIELKAISFRAPSENLRWEDLPPCFREQAEAYLAMRREPDLFELSPNHPRRPLAASTVRQ